MLSIPLALAVGGCSARSPRDTGREPSRSLVVGDTSPIKKPLRLHRLTAGGRNPDLTRTGVARRPPPPCLEQFWATTEGDAPFFFGSPGAAPPSRARQPGSAAGVRGWRWHSRSARRGRSSGGGRGGGSPRGRGEEGRGEQHKDGNGSMVYCLPHRQTLPPATHCGANTRRSSHAAAVVPYRRGPPPSVANSGGIDVCLPPHPSSSASDSGAKLWGRRARGETRGGALPVPPGRPSSKSVSTGPRRQAWWSARVPSGPPPTARPLQHNGDNSPPPDPTHLERGREERNASACAARRCRVSPSTRRLPPLGRGVGTPPSACQPNSL